MPRNVKQRIVVQRTVLAMLLGAALSVSAGAQSAEETQAPACKRAEINPVTGNVFCIDPLGAAVEPPPPEDAPPCKPDQRADADWTWVPTCTEE